MGRDEVKKGDKRARFGDGGRETEEWEERPYILLKGKEKNREGAEIFKYLVSFCMYNFYCVHQIQDLK